jgi:ribosomal protein L10
MDRSQKEELVSQMRDTLQQAASVIVARQTGLTVAEELSYVVICVWPELNSRF